jgi:hypothetical protein
MKTRALVLAASALIAASLPVIADGDKTVQNLKGSVSYQKPSKAAKPIAGQASIVLADKDLTITGLDSEAAVTLPDSSRVLVGSDAKVQLAFFNQTDIANAKFVIYQGRFRFNVEHPSGAKANYTFQTPTGNVAVRGTQGDIGVADDGTLSVNVYELSDPDLPVIVSTKDGQTFTLNVGQGFVGNFINGVVQGKVDDLKQQAVDQFSPDFGLPDNWPQLKAEICAKLDAQMPSKTVGIGPFSKTIGGTAPGC